MIIKLKITKGIKNKKNRRIIVWIQKTKEFDEDLIQLFQFFKENIKISKIRRIHKYYKIDSQNPAIIISLISAVNELIPEIYFKSENLKQSTLIGTIENF